MELAHSLLLNEEALKRIAENKRPVFVFEWLRFLDKVLVAAQKSVIKESQQKLIQQLTSQLSENPGPPTRKLLARCLATIFSVGDTFSLFDTINRCNDIIKSKDDSPSYLPTKLAAITCLGGIYEKLGRMVGRSYEETISLLVKSLKNAESQGRCEVMLTLTKVVTGLGSAGVPSYREVYKAARNCMTDRVMTVRCAAAKCLKELVKEFPMLYTSDLDTMAALCFRAMDGSNYEVRCEVSQLLGLLLSTALNAKPVPGSKHKVVKLEEVFNILASGFLKGGKSSPGEMIKGSSTVNREIRVGVTHAYVEFGKCMGGVWLDRSKGEFIDHVLGLLANPKSSSSHVDAVYSRKCVLFILRAVLGGVLSEQAQIAAAREICQIIVKHMALVDVAGDSDKASQELQLSQHVLVCALHELGCLIQNLSTSAAPLASDPTAGVVEPVFSVLIHPIPAARLAAAWCLRCIGMALPSQMAVLMERCISRMNHLKTSPEAISGYSFALAAMLGGVRETALGIPHAKGKQIFGIAEELLRTATQTSRLSLQRTQCGWLLLGAIMTLGPSVVKQHLPRMLLLWRNAFPRSSKELEAEKERGDGFTWQVTLEARGGALGAMHSFVLHCPELITEELIRRLLPPLECALSLTSHLPDMIRLNGSHLKAPSAMMRLRLYDVLALLPPKNYEGSFSVLLRELVAEFTLTDNPANTTTSKLRSLCHTNDSVILGSWLQETDHKAIEDQLQPNSASGSGALEHDAASLYMKAPPMDMVPGPLPLGVAVIDSSVSLFGLVFPFVAHKHRLQMLQHFGECIKQAKAVRQQAVQINIFTAVLCALKALGEMKSNLGPADVQSAAIQLVQGALASVNPILRCAGGEALGRMAQVVQETRFIAQMAQQSFDKLKSARDVVTRTGHSLALGCLHRYVGGMGSGQHLNTSVSILLALAQDQSSPVVQVWALHALGLIADSGGPMFRGYVEPALTLVLQLLLTVSPSNVDVHQCLGKCLAALITTIGPELQGNAGTITTARLSFLVCCATMQDHPDALVQAEAISCLQQMHLFAPRHVNMTTLVPHLCLTLSSPHLLLRRAAVSCLRQLSTREARELSEQAHSLSGGDMGISETGLEGRLFTMMDKEVDPTLCQHIQDTLESLLQALAADHLTRWLTLIKGVLQASMDASPLNSPADDTQTAKDDDNDEAELHVGKIDSEVLRPELAPRWPTRVFAIDCLLKVMAACEGNEVHFDLALARQLKASGKVDYLVLHLSELVRMAFIAATSDSDHLRLAGLSALQEIITKYSKAPEPEFPGHVILEQYQAQVGAALRPAFTPDTSPNVTAAACEVCSRWIGSGVARDLNDLRRVHQLLVSSLTKLQQGTDSSPIYNESASTMERLAVLKAWAEVYIVAITESQHRKEPSKTNDEEDEDEEVDEKALMGENLLSLVQPEIKALSQLWLAMLKDHVLLTLPPEYSSQLPVGGGTFYVSDTVDSARPHYRNSWAPVLYAVSLWLGRMGFISAVTDGNRPANVQGDENDIKQFHLLLGVCMEALCSPASLQPLSNIELCLRALYTILRETWPRTLLATDQALSIEVVTVLHRQLLTRDSNHCFILIVGILTLVLQGTLDSFSKIRHSIMENSSTDDQPANGSQNGSHDLPQPGKSYPTEDPGEGSKTGGTLVPGQSLVYSSLELCLCVLVRHMPALSPAVPSTGFQLPYKTSHDEVYQLISLVLDTLAILPGLCTPQATKAVLPTLLHLTIGVVKEMSPKGIPQVPPCVQVALRTLKCLCSSPMVAEPVCRDYWLETLQSAFYALLQYADVDVNKEYNGIESESLLSCLSVLLTTCPVQVTAVEPLLQRAVQQFVTVWLKEPHKMKVPCLRVTASVLQDAPQQVCQAFAETLLPHVIAYLLHAPTKVLQLDQEIRTAGFSVMEALVSCVNMEHKATPLQLLVKVLVVHLQTPDKQPGNRLYDIALDRLQYIAMTYPVQFKVIMASAPTLKATVQEAFKAMKQTESRRSEMQERRLAAATSSQPTIQLTMDFSRFQAS